MPHTSATHSCPFGEARFTRRSSPAAQTRVGVLYLLVLAASLLLPPATGAAIEGESSIDENIYNYYFNDHSSSDSNTISGNNGYTTDGADVDPYHHNGDYTIDINSEWSKIGSRARKPKCVDIPQNMTLCHDIGYKSMMLPNILEHDTLAEVMDQARSWVPLININCHPDAKVFLCSLFSPVCLDRLIYPCRSLCETVHANCEYRMKAHGFQWPEMLECTKYPVDNDMCIRPIHKVVADNNCTACRHPLTYESLIDHFCRADIVMKATLKGFIDVLGDRQLILRKKKKLYKAKGVSKGEARRLVPVIEKGASCVCETINATQERYLLMGQKKGDKMEIIFGIPWKKKNREFRRGIRAIRKSDTCEGIFNELSLNNGLDKRGGGSKKNSVGKKGKGRKKGRKKNKKGKKGRKKKGKGKKGRKGKKKRRKNRKGGKKGGRRDSKTNQTKTRPSASQEEKWEREDQALSNFLKAAN